MAQPFRRLIAAALLGAAGIFAAQPEAAAQATAASAVVQASERSAPGHPQEGEHFAAMHMVRRSLEALTPEQRRTFAVNLMRWVNLTPEEKKALREREVVREKFIEQELANAIQASGLQLEGERRAQFARRFLEERRKIEEQLRHEMIEKRRPLVRDLVGRLKVEFALPKP